MYLIVYDQSASTFSVAMQSNFSITKTPGLTKRGKKTGEGIHFSKKSRYSLQRDVSKIAF